MRSKVRLGLLVLTVGLTGPACRVEPHAGLDPDLVDPGVVAGPAPGRPAHGPWFVDRAPDFGLDVVARCGTPQKLSVLDSLGTGVAILDADGDGDLDLFVAPGSEVRDGSIVAAGGPWLFRNDGPGRWVDATAGSGLAHTGWAQGVAVCDYDADGDLDLFLAQHGPDTLWQNQGDGTFRDATEAAGIADREWGVSATWGDFDADGWPDLYVTNYLDVDPFRPPPPVSYYGTAIQVFRGPEHLNGEPDRLWRNRGDGTFEDATVDAGLFSPGGKGMAALFADLNADGVADLLVTNDTQANELYRGLGGGHFREEGLTAGFAYSDKGEAEASMAVDLADLDDDGRLDLAYSNFHDQGTRFLRNRDGSNYEDLSLCSGLTGLTLRSVGWGLVLADFDHDSRPDLFQANGHVYPIGPNDRYEQPPTLLRNGGADQFADRTATWGDRLDRLVSGRAVASGDLDGDGDLDLVMTTIDGPLRVLINEGRLEGHAIKLRLVGAHPNLEAIGARVELRAGGRDRVDQVRRGGSILAASDATLHFGLGPVDAVDRVRVRWPDGTTSDHAGAGLPVDATWTIRQGEAAPTVQPFAIVSP